MAESTQSQRYSIFSMGCKVSRIDAMALGGTLHGAGLERAEDSGTAEVLVVHTCSVTDRADRDDRKLIRRLRRENPTATLVVSGCLAQRDPEGLAAMPEVDLVLGHGVKRAIPELLEAREAGLLPGKVVWTPAHAETGVGTEAQLDPDRTRAFLKVQEGCERRCSFCVVPSLRGPERSAPPAEVEREIRRLGTAGVAEVVLAGVHLANYGKDLGGDLLSLLRRLEESPPACRIRLSSIEPMEAGSSLVDHVTRSAVVVPHLHLPLQAGSDRVLRRMRRGITAERFERLAARATANDRLHLATDVVVGFPGESDEEFEETLALVRRLRLASVHVFPFSPRSGTEGARLFAESPVPRHVVRERAEVLRQVAGEKLCAFRAAAAGSLADVVALRGGRGLTDNYLDVKLADGQAPGTRFAARLSASDDGALVAVAGC